MKKERLSEVQQKLLDLLKKNIDDPLTMRQLKDILDVSSLSNIHYHITQLEKKGFLKRNPFNPKDYQVLADAPDKKITYINLYGLATCGPNGSLLDGNPIEKVPISTRLLSFPSTEAFMVKAKGDSMAPKISNGDFVVAQRSNLAENGNIVVGVTDERVIIKEFHKTDETIILSSLNLDYPPFIANDFRIEGIVKTIIKYS